MVMSINYKMVERSAVKQSDSLFDEIREGFSFVAENAQHVFIDQARLKEFAVSLPAFMPDNIFDEDHHYIGDDEQTAAYVMTLDAINFGSGFDPGLREEGWPVIDDSLYFTIATYLKNHFVEHGPFSAAQLNGIEVSQVLELLKLSFDGMVSFDFARLCTLSLRELGGMILSEYNGSFYSFVQATQGQASNCVAMMARLQGFYDVHQYKGRNILILKRAQSTAADLNDAFTRKDGAALYSDIGKLTILPDNDIPHILRCEGVLRYSDELSARIEKEQLIQSGCEEEVELRACSAYAVEEMAKLKAMPVIELDRILWHKCNEDSRYKVGKAHRTRSRFY